MRGTVGTDFIAEERMRQIEVEGYDREHDGGHSSAELASAGAAYALAEALLTGEDCPVHPLDVWPWEESQYNPKTGDERVKNLIRAGALIAAAIDRVVASWPVVMPGKEKGDA